MKFIGGSFLIKMGSYSIDNRRGVRHKNICKTLISCKFKKNVTVPSSLLGRTDRQATIDVFNNSLNMNDMNW